MRIRTPRPERPDSPRDARRVLDFIEATAAGAGIKLAKPLTAARTELDRAERVVAEARAAREDEQSAAHRLAGGLVAGKLDLVDAATEGSSVETGTVLAEALRLTPVQSVSGAWRAFAANCDGDAVISQCCETVEKIVHEVRGLRPLLEGVHDDHQARRAGPETAAGWASYHAALDRWDACFHLAMLLRRYGFAAAIPVVEPVRWPKPDRPWRCGRRYAKPELTGEARTRAKRQGVAFRELLDESCDEAGPITPPTAEQEIAYWAEAVRLAEQEFAEREAEIVKRGGVSRVVAV